MTIKIYKELEQGTSEWLQARCGIVTASTVGQLISKTTLGATHFECPDCHSHPHDPCIGARGNPIKTMHPARAEHAREQNVQKLAPATGDTAEMLSKTLIAERITGHVEPAPTSRAMERGNLDEPYARLAYEERTGTSVDEIGFMTEDKHGYILGYSPDGLVGDDGLLEIKSRTQRIQLQTILADEVPAGNLAQLQHGLLVSGRAWIDYVSYCGGMPLYVKRVYPDPEWHEAILAAVKLFEDKATSIISRYLEATAGQPNTERIDHFPETELVF